MDDLNEKQPAELQKADGAADTASEATDAGEATPTPIESDTGTAPEGAVTNEVEADQPIDEETAPHIADADDSSETAVSTESEVLEALGVGEDGDDVAVTALAEADELDVGFDTPEPVAEAEEPGVDETDASDFGDAATAEGEPDEQVSMMELLMQEGDFMPEKYRRGDLVEGRVLRKDKDQIILDIGAKQEGVVPSSDLARLPREVVDSIEVGETIQTVVIRPEGREGEVLVSINQARTLADWDNASESLDSGEILELEIVGFNKGGALVGFGNLQGFVPRSHLVRLPAPRGSDDASEGLAALVGESVPVKVIEVSRRKRRLIMSERLALREWRSERKQRLLEQLREGEIRKGRVSSIADFGAFVDLGGADGLVHVSELTYERGKHPRDVVSVGQEVEVYVLNIDRDRKRIGLSMKRLQSDPWETVEEDHYVGELVEANISNLAKFGAFARLEDGLEGLIHISELSDEHVEHPREAVRPGQRVTVEIISIEPHRQRIGLSIRRVPRHLRTIDEAPDEMPDEMQDEIEADYEHDVEADIDVTDLGDEGSGEAVTEGEETEGEEPEGEEPEDEEPEDEEPEDEEPEDEEPEALDAATVDEEEAEVPAAESADEPEVESDGDDSEVLDEDADEDAYEDEPFGDDESVAEDADEDVDEAEPSVEAEPGDEDDSAGPDEDDEPETETADEDDEEADDASDESPDEESEGEDTTDEE
ncbi:MAG: S1 RNA-binding domain-containing protein [Anaerolineae bacterium]